MQELRGEIWVQPTLTPPCIGEGARWLLSLFLPISRESQNGASEVSDWSAMQKGLIPGQVGELWSHGLLFILPPTMEPFCGQAHVPSWLKGLLAVCCQIILWLQESLFHLTSYWLQFLFHVPSVVPFPLYLNENLYH